MEEPQGLRSPPEIPARSAEPPPDAGESPSTAGGAAEAEIGDVDGEDTKKRKAEVPDAAGAAAKRRRACPAALEKAAPQDVGFSFAVDASVCSNESTPRFGSFNPGLESTPPLIPAAAAAQGSLGLSSSEIETVRPAAAAAAEIGEVGGDDEFSAVSNWL